jgi:hypothetical protein
MAQNSPRAFGVFYERHVRVVHGYFRRRAPDAETALI